MPDLVSQGQVHWFDFGRPAGSEPGGHRPVLVVQGDHLNHSKWSTTVVAPITSNIALGSLPGSVLIPAAVAGLERHSVVLLTGLSTVEKVCLGPAVGLLPVALWQEVLRAFDQMVGRVSTLRD